MQTARRAVFLASEPTEAGPSRQPLRFARNDCGLVRVFEPIGRGIPVGTRLAALLPMLRKRALGALERFGAIDALLRARLPGTWLPILSYHRIHPDPDGQHFDRGVIDATPDELDRQLAWIARYFTPIGVDRLADHVTRGVPLPARAALVTFDDGYRECFTQALPILLSHGIRASFFIPTGCVSERRVFWWDRLSYVLRTSTEACVQLSYPVRVDLELGVDRRPAISRLLALIKSSRELEFERFFAGLEAAAGVRWSDALERRFADELLMSWGEIRTLAAAGMEIHSHTRTHRILQNLHPSELQSELRGSRRDLMSELGSRARAVAYPVGRSILGRPEIVKEMRAAGYELGFCLGVRSFGRGTDPFDIGRIAPDRGMSSARFRALLLHPALAV